MRQSLQSLQDVQQRYRWFQQMRTTHPVCRDETSGCWHVFRYADVNNVLSDYTHFSSDFRWRIPARSSLTAPSLISMDPPQHGKYRKLISPIFTPRALSQLSARITVIVQELLDRARPAGKMDVIADLAYPLPVTVIAEMLGVPTADRPVFKRWADTLFSSQLSDAELLQAEETEQYRQTRSMIQEMTAYFAQRLEEHRRQPRADLMSELLAAEVDGAPISQEEIVSFCFLLLLPGPLTTTNLLGQPILSFDPYPHALEQLRQQPHLIPAAIQAVPPSASPVWRIGRITTTHTVITHMPTPPVPPPF